MWQLRQDVATDRRADSLEIVRHFVPHPSRCSGPPLRAFCNALRRSREGGLRECDSHERPHTDVRAGPQRGMDARASRHASGPPSSSEHRGEPHVGERRYRKYRPVRSETMDGEASRRERLDQTENIGSGYHSPRRSGAVWDGREIVGRGATLLCFGELKVDRHDGGVFDRCPVLIGGKKSHLHGVLDGSLIEALVA